MLHHESVAPHTLGLLKGLSGLPALNGFCLVGGTALALQIGHRMSVDLDFFTFAGYDTEIVIDEINKLGYTVNILVKKENNLNLVINEVKVDLLKYSYPLIDKIVEEEGITMLGKKDIALMKLSAIANRSDRKDFVDLYFLLKELDFQELIVLFKKKYQMEELFHIYKSLTYYNDADEQAELSMLVPVSWTEIKKYFVQLVSTI